MPYTLMKGLAWILLAVALGIVIGWLLRSVAAKRQVERARAGAGDAATDDELARLRARVANLEPIVAERDRLAVDLAEARRAPPATAARRPDAVESRSDAVGVPDGDASGTPPTELDDLTAVVGIGPDVAELCRGIGITTWAELSVTEVSLLRTMLGDAGVDPASCDPSTWPKQAALLAAGDWAGFRDLAVQVGGDGATG